MIVTNSIISLIICLATAADLVLLMNLERGGNFRLSGIICTLVLSVAYLANIFAMQESFAPTVAPTELLCNVAVLAYQVRRTWVLVQLATGHSEKLPSYLRHKANV